MTDEQPPPRTPEQPPRSAARELAHLLQGVVLDRTALGVVLLGIVVVLAGLLEATGAARAVAIAVGALGALAVLVGWRRHWRDRVLWPVVLGAAVAELAAFVTATRA